MSTPEEGSAVNKPLYEIPVTDPGVGSDAAPADAGALRRRRAASPSAPQTIQPPEPPGPGSVDFSHLPPPAVVPVDTQIPAPAPAAAAPAESIPGFFPPPTAESMPGFTPAPYATVIPMPDFQIVPPLRVVERDARPTFVPDEFTVAARARADADLLAAMESVIEEGASDLHVSIGSPPMIRVDGALRPAPGHDVWDRERVAAALYSLMTDEQRAHFDEVLELDFAFTLSESARFRVNFYLQRGAIGGAFRLIPTEIKTLTQLGIPEVVANFSKLARGLVLVTGPTGSGKSTTLAALIDLVNQTRSDHIVTVEDPIEFLHTNKRALINQREVGSDTQSFGNALKHVLRQDPDVILIGELRDLETISVALTAAETGHLVFATLHTQDAGQTIDRIIDVFPPHQQGQVRAQLASTLQGVVCQTLLRRASGSGRAVATEVLVTTPAIANLIREGKTYQVRSALQAGKAHGMFTMDQNLAELVNGGDVAYGAAIEKVHDQEDFKRLVHRKIDADPVAAAFGGAFGTEA